MVPRRRAPKRSPTHMGLRRRSASPAPGRVDLGVRRARRFGSAAEDLESPVHTPGLATTRPANGVLRSWRPHVAPRRGQCAEPRPPTPGFDPRGVKSGRPTAPKSADFSPPAVQSPGGVGGLRPLPSSYCAISAAPPSRSRPPWHAGTRPDRHTSRGCLGVLGGRPDRHTSSGGQRWSS